MQHIEFFDKFHFEHRYFRTPPPPALAHFIDFFWQTDFDDLLAENPGGFSDVLFPNTGYTYLINLGTPYVMQVGERKFDMKGDGFLPRHQSIECYHRKGNNLFGIKFRVSPILFEKKINFSEYREYIFPLSYLVDSGVIAKVKMAQDFKQRTLLLSNYYESIILKQPAFKVTEVSNPVNIVLEILGYSDKQNDFTTPVSAFAEKYKVSARTLQRYFEMATGASPRKLIQIMRIRKATEMLVTDPKNFRSTDFGYYDHSHFYKYLKQFLHKNTITRLRPHLELLASMHQGDI
ncbi:MAG: AraC family transcriptional regulator [Chitinophagaceae bacterium]|nr:MAG: AraC family transcriptional regulator [Chitinophagaceae bacterium]